MALGRCSLDPLPVLASLCGPSAEILAMALHPLKDLLPRAELLAAAERVCITAVNQARTPCHSTLPPALRRGMQRNVGSSTPGRACGKSTTWKSLCILLQTAQEQTAPQMCAHHKEAHAPCGP